MVDTEIEETLRFGRSTRGQERYGGVWFGFYFPGRRLELLPFVLMCRWVRYHVAGDERQMKSTATTFTVLRKDLKSVDFSLPSDFQMLIGVDVVDGTALGRLVWQTEVSYGDVLPPASDVSVLHIKLEPKVSPPSDSWWFDRFRRLHETAQGEVCSRYAGASLCVVLLNWGSRAGDGGLMDANAKKED
jgi:hypothetical protein